MNAFSELMATQEGRREYCVEQTITNVTEKICELLQQSGMERQDLASAMGVTPGRISQMLDGSANLTLRSVASA